ncbi:glycosyltransferase family 4 protein [Candidatus Kaiserbacteria bacterium]|nr:glycosyltransferase family 4 protein [Candidatus Kaiserbacteria bacterium]
MLSLLVLLTKRQPPSSRLRMTACFDEFHKHGIEATSIPIPSDFLGRIGLMRQAARHDFVIIQKKTSFHSFELGLLQRANRNLIFDMDDAVMFHELEHHKPLTGKNFIKFIRTINHCRAVVAGNTSLAKYAEANCDIVKVLPTPVDLARYRVKDYSQTTDAITIGWVGVAGSLHFLRQLVPTLQELAGEFPRLQIKIVCNDFIDIPGVPTVKQTWALEDETEQLRSFDIGIMPLADSLWARGKCGYKILQYFGAGVPAVASPVGINVEFIRHRQTGMLANTPAEWKDSLRALILDADLRKRIGLAGRHEVESKYALTNYAAGYAQLIHDMRDLDVLPTV